MNVVQPKEPFPVLIKNRISDSDIVKAVDIGDFQTKVKSVGLFKTYLVILLALSFSTKFKCLRQSFTLVSLIIFISICFLGTT